jgi:hypothetical protein
MKKASSKQVSTAAAVLGKRGGNARSRVLTKKRQHDIAAQGGRAKARKGA